MAAEQTEPLLNKEIVLTLLYYEAPFTCKTKQHIVCASPCFSSVAKL